MILATGAESITPPIPGVDRSDVVDAWDLLAGKASAQGRVVVVGGGAVGVETALMLAEEGTLPAETLKFLLIHGVEDADELRRLAIEGTNRVTLVEQLKKVGQDVGRSTRWTFHQGLSKLGVEVMVTTKVLDIGDEGVVVEQEGATRTLPADVVVLAAGARSYNPLQAELESKGLDVHIIGDAQKVGNAFDATHAGYKTARSL